MAKVNKHKVPSNAVLVQTVIASLFALVAFIVFPSLGVGGGQPIDIQTKVYDVLQAAVTVIWCLSMVVLFVDVVIIIRRTTTTTTPTPTSSPPSSISRGHDHSDAAGRPHRAGRTRPADRAGRAAGVAGARAHPGARVHPTVG